MNFCCVKPSSLQSSIPAATGNHDKSQTHHGNRTDSAEISSWGQSPKEAAPLTPFSDSVSLSGAGAVEEKAPSVPQVFVVPSGPQLRTQEASNEHTGGPQNLGCQSQWGRPPRGPDTGTWGAWGKGAPGDQGRVHRADPQGLSVQNPILAPEPPESKGRVLPSQGCGLRRIQLVAAQETSGVPEWWRVPPRGSLGPSQHPPGAWWEGGSLCPGARRGGCPGPSLCPCGPLQASLQRPWDGGRCTAWKLPHPGRPRLWKRSPRNPGARASVLQRPKNQLQDSISDTGL